MTCIVILHVLPQLCIDEEGRRQSHLEPLLEPHLEPFLAILAIFWAISGHFLKKTPPDDLKINVFGNRTPKL